MSQRAAAWVLLALLPMASLAARAGVFEEAFAHAERNDPTFRAARQELASAQSGISVARAALLPNAALSISNAQVRGERTAPNIFGQAVTTPLDYRAPQQSVSVRVPLLNREATQRLRQAEAQALLAASQLAVRRYELLERLGQAYLQRLYAEHGVATFSVQLATAREQGRLAARRLELGEGTRQELSQADAELALAEVQLSEARNQASAAAFVLFQLSGPAMPLPPRDPARYPLPALSPATLDAWQERAAADSPAASARRIAFDVARIGVDRAGSGHLPRLDLVASVSNSRNESISTVNQASRQRSLGVQFNLPLYAGGGVEAAVAQALAEQERAQAQLDAELQDVQADIQRLFLSAQTGTARVLALRQARENGLLQVRAARLALDRGLGTQSEVVRAESRLSDSTRELARAHYDHLLVLLRLHARAGIPAPDIARLLDDALQPS